MLSIEDLHLSLGDRVLADGLSLDLHPGQLNVIIGPNGTGKSSLFRAIFGELRFRQGTISLAGASLDEVGVGAWRKRFGYMPQDIQLDVALSALEVTLLGALDDLGLNLSEEVLKRALTTLDRVGMLEYADREMHTLSGGQRQMVLFAQVLLRQPEVMLLDEPVSALDLHHQQVLLEQLTKQTRDHQWITAVVLHDLNLAAQYADNLIVLNNGALAAAGAPADVLTAELVEEIYQVKTQVLHDADGQPFVRTLRYTA